MKCTEIERMIYLFGELEENERRMVNQHIATCISCEKLHERQQEYRSAIKKFAATSPIANKGRLTDQIMAAIEKKETRSHVDLLERVLLTSPAKFSLAAVSLFLFMFFISEINQPGIVSRPFYTDKLISTIKTDPWNLSADQVLAFKAVKQNHSMAGLFQFLRKRHVEELSYFNQFKNTKLKGR